MGQDFIFHIDILRMFYVQLVFCPNRFASWLHVISPVAAWKKNVHIFKSSLFVKLLQPQWSPGPQTLDFVSDPCCIVALLYGWAFNCWSTLWTLMQDVTVDQQLWCRDAIYNYSTPSRLCETYSSPQTLLCVPPQTFPNSGRTLFKLLRFKCPAAIFKSHKKKIQKGEVVFHIAAAAFPGFGRKHGRGWVIHRSEDVWRKRRGGFWRHGTAACVHTTNLYLIWQLTG